MLVHPDPDDPAAHATAVHERRNGARTAARTIRAVRPCPVVALALQCARLFNAVRTHARTHMLARFQRCSGYSD